VAGDPERCAVVDVVDGGVAVATVRIEGALPGLLVVDTVARLQVAAARLGWSVVWRDPSDEARELLELAGLSDVLAADPSGSALE
jgi:hypothetical protein